MPFVAFTTVVEDVEKEKYEAKKSDGFAIKGGVGERPKATSSLFENPDKTIKETKTAKPVATPAFEAKLAHSGSLKINAKKKK